MIVEQVACGRSAAQPQFEVSVAQRGCRSAEAQVGMQSGRAPKVTRSSRHAIAVFFMVRWVLNSKIVLLSPQRSGLSAGGSILIYH